MLEFRDFLPEVRQVARYEMAKEHGVNLYFEQEGKLVKVDDLAQIYLFAVPW